MRDADRIKRYTLVPRSQANGRPDGLRRYSLARIGTAPRSALGSDRMDRLERMERIAEAEREESPDSRNGDDPGKRPQDA